MVGLVYAPYTHVDHHAFCKIGVILAISISSICVKPSRQSGNLPGSILLSAENFKDIFVTLTSVTNIR